jgi:hypothetical protein
MEGVDVNDEQDWWLAAHLLESGQAALPLVPNAPYSSN